MASATWASAGPRGPAARPGLRRPARPRSPTVALRGPRTSRGGAHPPRRPRHGGLFVDLDDFRTVTTRSARRRRPDAAPGRPASDGGAQLGHRGRFGGDEFASWSRARRGDEARTIGDRVHERLEQPSIDATSCSAARASHRAGSPGRQRGAHAQRRHRDVRRQGRGQKAGPRSSEPTHAHGGRARPAAQRATCAAPGERPAGRSTSRSARPRQCWAPRPGPLDHPTMGQSRPDFIRSPRKPASSWSWPAWC